MNRMAAAGAVSLVLIAVFVAIAVSVVDARRPLDGRVSASFDQVMTKAFTSGSVTPSGCVKVRVDTYRCSAEVSERSGATQTTYWMMLLADDGCWRAYVRWPRASAGSIEAKLGYPRGCSG